MKNSKVDRTFLFTAALLVVVGFFIFSSASLGLLARDGARFSSVAFSQIFLGIILGSVSLLLMMRTDYKKLKKYSLAIFITSIVATLLVFIPGLGFEYNGATRWISIAGLSVQPAEFLKLGFVIYFAAWLSGIRDKLHTFSYGVLPFIVLSIVVATPLLLQPDTGTLLVIYAAGFAMFLAAGARIRDIFTLVGAALLGGATLILMRPYIMDRILAFIDPSKDPLGSSYQIQQSLIAIGSGGFFGRGFGQSIQKFNYLPEPIGDSIFAVVAEEFGFLGAFLLISIFLFFAFRGLRIASKSKDHFGGLLVVGIVILIVSQSFINIASMLGVFPLTGLPLLFVSHGGSALFFTLLSVGIVLNVSKYSRRK
jgi:cell division protein FtsW